MYRKIFWSAACIFLVTLHMVAANSRNPTSAMQIQIPTPTIATTSSPKPFDYPGIASLLPGTAFSQAQQAITDMGYDLTLETQSQNGTGMQQYAVNILWQRPNSTTSTTARMDAYLLTQNGIIIETYIELLRIGNAQLSAAEWQFVDPKAIYNIYGEPDIARAWLFAADDSMRGMVFSIWSDLGIAVEHSLPLKPSDFPPPYTNAQLCFTSDRVRFFRVVIAPSRDLFASLDRAYNGFWTFGQPFSPTMFTNAPDLATLAQRLANGECLETRREVWFGSQ